MMVKATYLDYNATAPLRGEAQDAMEKAIRDWGNPSSVHAFGRRARAVMEDARDAVAALANVPSNEVIFTSGGTEANNLALRGTAIKKVFVSAVEHPSVLGAVKKRKLLTVDGTGKVDLESFQVMLEVEQSPVLVSVMLANNETGVIQPVKQIAKIAKDHGALVHCDAVQAAGKLPLDRRELGVDMLSLSAHKLGGPPGVGALIADPALKLTSVIRGGGQERGLRAGTENLTGIAGFGAAAAVAVAELPSIKEIEALRDEMERGLLSAAPEITIFGKMAARLPNTSYLAMPGVKAETQLMALDLDRVYVSAGSACSSGKVASSHVLRAMGVPEKDAASAIRISLGWASDREDIERFIEAWTALYRRLGRTKQENVPAA